MMGVHTSYRIVGPRRAPNHARVLALLLAGALSVAPRTSARADDAGPPTREARADSPSLDATLSKIARARKHLKTLRGPIEQIRKLRLFKEEVRTRGRLVLVMPDRLLWQLDAPEHARYWVGPEGLSVETPHTRATTRDTDSALADALEDLRTLLGGDLRRLEKRYRLRVEQGTGDAVVVVATLRAGQPKRGLRELRIGFDPRSWHPKTAELLEAGGDSTVIRFGRLEENVPIDPTTMRPSPHKR